MSNENDLIRRGDAMKALGWGDIYGSNAQDAIAALPAAPMGVKVGDQRPLNCRFRLQDEGKAYPRSSCRECGKGITTGLGKQCNIAALAALKGGAE
jgi:hypothetical protein